MSAAARLTTALVVALIPVAGSAEIYRLDGPAIIGPLPALTGPVVSLRPVSRAPEAAIPVVDVPLAVTPPSTGLVGPPRTGASAAPAEPRTPAQPFTPEPETTDPLTAANDAVPGQQTPAALNAQPPVSDRPLASKLPPRIRPATRPANVALRHAPETSLRPAARRAGLPDARWDFKPRGALWTRAALSAIDSHGEKLETVVPRDIDAWCPAYPQAGPAQRRAFWVGMMSALAKHESTYNPRAVGGGDLWYGLLQIYPDTARRYGCQARTGAALKAGGANLSCAVRIMNVTVPRDRAVALHDGRWRGVAADWGPMVSSAKRRDMQAWTRQQSYCTELSAQRPRLRPDGLAPDAPVLAATQNDPR